MLFKNNKTLSLQNVYVYYAVSGFPFLLLVLAMNLDLIDQVFFVIGLLAWIVFYHPLVTGMRRNMRNVRKLIEARAEAQELTYQHISREIHDNINLSLIVSRIHLLGIREKDEEYGKKIGAAIGLISKSLDDLSNLSRSYNLERFKHGGFLRVLQQEIMRLKLADLLNIDLQAQGNPVALTVDREMHIYRIIQESLSNIIKHAEAKNIYIHLNYHSRYLELVIKDDGKGFEYFRGNTCRSAGLSNMKLRAKAASGDLTIQSALGKGTSVSLSVPYKEIKSSLFRFFN